MWSKAEKRAVLSLTEYATSHAESDYQQYLVEIAVPAGDKPMPASAWLDRNHPVEQMTWCPGEPMLIQFAPLLE